jgi:hypothetical protein
MRGRKLRFLRDDALEKLLAGIACYGDLLAVAQWGGD